MTIAVAFEEVEYVYPGGVSPALSGATFALPEGSFVLVTGPTGAGKSTLLRAINGLVPHFSGGSFGGLVVVNGRSTLDVLPRALADTVAFVPQNPGAAFVLDRVEDELAYAMENLAVTPSTMRRRVEEALDLLDIAGLRERSVRSLSGGERQRVAIAAALTTNPRVLVLDEPTSQLDPQGAEDVLAALQRLVHDLGLTVVIAEHRLERVAGFAELAVGVRAGRPPVTGGAAEVLEELASGPPVTRLGRLLGWQPPPLTVRDARRRAPRLPSRSGVESAAEPRSEPAVAAHRLHAGYGGRDVLRGVDFELRPGEIVALMGRNGAGKSTLLRCIAGLHEPRGGEVSARRGGVRTGIDVALCPQEPEAILFRDRVVDEVATTLRRGGRRADPRSILDALSITSLADSHPRDLSAGQRLLVAVGAIVATGAPVLLLDEPTRGLDAETKHALAGFVRSFAHEGGAAAFATHDVELVAELAGRVVMLAGGEVIADGSVAAVLGDSAVFAPQMTRVFGPGWLTPQQVAAAVGAP